MCIEIRDTEKTDVERINNMKIGLISINMYSKGLNFASPLHTYAFQQFLLKHCIESIIIDYKPVYFDNFNLKYPSDYYKEKYEKLCEIRTKRKLTEDETKKIKRYERKYLNWETLREERAVRYEKFQRFIDNNYIKTQEVYNSDLLETEDPMFDCYICVTDVIWKLSEKGFDRGFFLASKCMENKWKISYSASRGVFKSYDEEQYNQFQQYIKDIDYVSVREKSLANYINEYLKRSAIVVLDPVMLHKKDFYQRIIQKPEEKNYILLYYVMGKALDTVSYAVKYAKEHRLKIIEISDQEIKEGSVHDSEVEVSVKYNIGIEEWLGYIENAECIFTNSFHASCFSILFEKDFFVGNRKGDKVSNLLSTFGLERRHIGENSIIVANETEIPRDDEKLKLQDTIKRYEMRIKFCAALKQFLKLNIIKKGLNDKILYLSVEKGKLEKKLTLEYICKEIDYTEVNDILEEKRIESEQYILNAICEIKEKKEKVKKDYSIYHKKVMFQLKYHSGRAKDDLGCYGEGVIVDELPSGAIVYYEQEKKSNSGEERFDLNQFYWKNHEFIGWNLRYRIDNEWFWFLEGGESIQEKKYDKQIHFKKLFVDGEKIPYLEINNVSMMVVEAQWRDGQ